MNRVQRSGAAGSSAPLTRFDKAEHSSRCRATESGHAKGVGAGIRSRVGSRVGLLVYDGVHALDATVLTEALASANRILGYQAFDVTMVSIDDGAIGSSNGFHLGPCVSYRRIAPFDFDTLIVAGGSTWSAVLRYKELIRWLRATSHSAARVCGLCPGTLLLRSLGLMQGQWTTHWSFFGRLPKNARPPVDSVIAKDGSRYTCAGLAATADLALLMIEEDCGSETAKNVAASMLVPMRRSHQSPQLSTQLLDQMQEADRMEQLCQCIHENPAQELSIATMARMTAMSPRNFARRFKEASGMTPRQYVARVRFEKAKTELLTTRKTVSEIARSVGFGDDDAMRREFQRVSGKSPSQFRAALSIREQVGGQRTRSV